MPGGDGRGVEHQDVDAPVPDLNGQAGAKGGHEGLRGRVERREGRRDRGRRAAGEHDAAAQVLGHLHACMHTHNVACMHAHAFAWMQACRHAPGCRLIPQPHSCTLQSRQLRQRLWQQQRRLVVGASGSRHYALHGYSWGREKLPEWSAGWMRTMSARKWCVMATAHTALHSRLASCCSSGLHNNIES